MCIFFTLEPFKGAEYNEHREKASGAWQGSLTMCSFRRFHAEPRKTSGVLLLSSKANKRVLDIVFPHGLGIKTKFESQFGLVHHLVYTSAGKIFILKY